MQESWNFWPKILFYPASEHKSADQLRLFFPHMASTCFLMMWLIYLLRVIIDNTRIIEPAHEIMALFLLRKFILQIRMRSHPAGLDVWFFVGPFLYFHTSCVRTAKALARLRGCAGLPEPSLVAYAISTKISWAGSIIISSNCWMS